ncbi:hypothetical protein K1719_032694 [Acacia pycnantha]|nr:hypothetical protein K1719_032694 [Acacia pycnantha]
MNDALNVKEAPPPLPTDSLRSTKKVRIRPDGADGGVADGVMETGGSDVCMVETESSGAASYRNKLLNMNGDGGARPPKGELVVSEKDYRINREGEVPSIEFSMEVREALVKGMENTLVIKLLGRSVTYEDLLQKTQGLWRLKGSYQLIESPYWGTLDGVWSLSHGATLDS